RPGARGTAWWSRHHGDGRRSGAKGNRTPDLFHAMEALYQLSYSPAGALTLAVAPRATTNAGGPRRRVVADLVVPVGAPGGRPPGGARRTPGISVPGRGGVLTTMRHHG